MNRFRSEKQQFQQYKSCRQICCYRQLSYTCLVHQSVEFFIDDHVLRFKILSLFLCTIWNEFCFIRFFFSGYETKEKPPVALSNHSSLHILHKEVLVYNLRRWEDFHWKQSTVYDAISSWNKSIYAVKYVVKSSCFFRRMMLPWKESGIVVTSSLVEVKTKVAS